MNQVYLSGTIFDEPKLISKPDVAPHLVFLLQVNHSSKKGLQKELYRINAWNGCAMTNAQILKKGMRTGLHGYLVQRSVTVGDQAFTAVEVTMEDAFPSHILEMKTQEAYVELPVEV